MSIPVILVGPMLAAQWQFGINDPSFIAWLIFGVYFISAALCWRAGSGNSSKANPQTRELWRILSLALVVLGFNKQLDLHLLLKDVAGELVAKRDEIPKLLVVGGVVVLGLVAAVITWLAVKRFWRSLIDLRWVYGIFFALLGLQVLRFIPGPIADLLLAHVFTEEEGILHIHIIELFELAGLVAIGYLAHVAARETSASVS
jgi:hypothetical protein